MNGMHNLNDRGSFRKNPKGGGGGKSMLEDILGGVHIVNNNQF